MQHSKLLLGASQAVTTNAGRRHSHVPITSDGVCTFSSPWHSWCPCPRAARCCTLSPVLWPSFLGVPPRHAREAPGKLSRCALRSEASARFQGAQRPEASRQAGSRSPSRGHQTCRGLLSRVLQGEGTLLVGGVEQQDGAQHPAAHGGGQPRLGLPQPAGPRLPRGHHPAEGRVLRYPQRAPPARRLRRHRPPEDGVEAPQPHGLRPPQRRPAAPQPARRRHRPPRQQPAPAEGVRRNGGGRRGGRRGAPQPAQRLLQGRVGRPQLVTARHAPPAGPRPLAGGARWCPAPMALCCPSHARVLVSRCCAVVSVKHD